MNKGAIVVGSEKMLGNLFGWRKMTVRFSVNDMAMIFLGNVFCLKRVQAIPCSKILVVI